jgi:hypothetical protein
VREDEFAELLRHVRRRVREAGLGDVDDAAVGRLREETLRPSDMVLRYLVALDAALGARSSATVDRTVGRLNQHVAPRGAAPAIETITLELSGIGAVQAGIDRVDLRELPDLTDVRLMLGELIFTLRDEREER